MKNNYSFQTKVIIADDHRLLADGLELILNDARCFKVVAKVNNGKLLLDTLNSISADLILLDISMPLMNGIDAAITIKKRNPGVKIVFISMNYNPQLKLLMQQHNIDGFIIKTVNASGLKEALGNIIMGNKTFLLPDRPLPSDTSFQNSEFINLFKLTKTEVEIIQLISKGNSTKIIAAIRNLSYLTVETHRKNIFRKLNAKNMAQVVAFAVKNGII